MFLSRSTGSGTATQAKLPNEPNPINEHLRPAGALVHTAKSADSWVMHGRDYSETRYSALKQINASSVSNTWSVVFALDARTGKQLWKWDPDDPRNPAPIMLTPANRGVAYYDGKVYMGMLDDGSRPSRRKPARLFGKSRLT